MVEIPLLEKQFQEQIQSDRLFHEQQEEEKVGERERERGSEDGEGRDEAFSSFVLH